MPRTRKEALFTTAMPAYPARFSTTTEGRQELPSNLQDVYGEKAIIGFHRYGRIIAAMIPMEAVKMLAGQQDAVDDEMKIRIRNTAQNLLGGKGELR